MVAALVATAAALAAPPNATLTATTHQPVVDQPWRWTVTVKDGSGKPARARVKLQVLLGTTVVGCWKGNAMAPCSGASAGTPIAFRGRKSGVIRWPAQSVGARLTFQAVVTAGKQTRRLRYAISVRRA